MSPLCSEQTMYRDRCHKSENCRLQERAEVKIQAAYRGYSFRRKMSKIGLSLLDYTRTVMQEDRIEREVRYSTAG